METILITGLLLATLILIITVVSLLAKRLGEVQSLPNGLITLLPLFAGDEDAGARIQHLLCELRWLDESLVGRVLLVNMDLTEADPLYRDCLALCEQYEHLSICSHAQLTARLEREIYTKSTG